MHHTLTTCDLIHRPASHDCWLGSSVCACMVGSKCDHLKPTMTMRSRPCNSSCMLGPELHHRGRVWPSMRLCKTVLASIPLTAWGDPVEHTCCRLVQRPYETSIPDLPWGVAPLPPPNLPPHPQTDIPAHRLQQLLHSSALEPDPHRELLRHLPLMCHRQLTQRAACQHEHSVGPVQNAPVLSRDLCPATPPPPPPLKSNLLARC